MDKKSLTLFGDKLKSNAQTDLVFDKLLSVYVRETVASPSIWPAISTKENS